MCPVAGGDVVGGDRHVVQRVVVVLAGRELGAHRLELAQIVELAATLASGLRAWCDLSLVVAGLEVDRWPRSWLG
jgi:hypothetical protein